MGVRRWYVVVGLSASLGVAGCTTISSSFSPYTLNCLIAGSCNCIRSIVDGFVPMNLPTSGSGLDPYKSLTPYLAQQNGSYVLENPWHRFAFGSLEVSGRFLTSDFRLVNVYGNSIQRQGMNVNHYLALRARFRLELPLEWAAYTGTIRLAVLTNAGGVLLKTKTTGGQVATLIDQQSYQRSRLYCSAPGSEVVMSPGVSTDVDFVSNFADGNNLLYDTSVGHGAYGGLYLAAFNIPNFPASDTSACGQDFYHRDDPTRPPGALTQDDLFGDGTPANPGKGFYTIPWFVMQVTDEHRAQHNLPICGVDD
jgi:hypothetical protein